MSYHWKSTIITKSNVIHNVEFETPGVWREDAIAQVKSMYDAKEVKNCIPISKNSSFTNKSNNINSSSDMNLIIGFGILTLLYILRYVILFCVIIVFIYFLFKSIQFLIKSVINEQ